MEKSGDESVGASTKDKVKRGKFGKGPELVRGKLQGNFLVPSFITVVGIFCGFLAIISAIKGRYDYAAKCIGLAIILDGLDGRVARRLNATSAFGREFDSLSDAIAFGVAPAVLIYLWGFNSVADEFGLLISFLFVACGATRLARFNVTTSDEPKKHFSGLPIPGAAFALLSIVIVFSEPLQNPVVVAGMLTYTALLGFLMVSTIPFFSIKHLKLSQGNPRRNVALLAFVVALMWYYSRFVLLAVATGYALSGLIFLLYRKILKRDKKLLKTGTKSS